jgi:hypothetical protein
MVVGFTIIYAISTYHHIAYSNKGNSLKDFFFAICQFKDLFCNIKDNAWKKDNEKYVINIL